MFISYQKVRNTIVGFFMAIFVGVGAFFGLRQPETPQPQARSSRSMVRQSPSEHAAKRQSPSVPARASKRTDSSALPKQNSNTALAAQTPSVSGSWGDSQGAAGLVANPQTSTKQQAQQHSPVPPKNNDRRYVNAMKLASAKAAPGGKGKDVLGSSNPWKLNLYDDNNDGQYDRGKLDWNRDEIDDEKWTYKQGRWEKESGKFVWDGKQWTVPGSVARLEGAGSNPDLERYRLAMNFASRRAHVTGKGKDVMGAGHPWKLNLYDDDKDGQWDRGKLDTNRDEVDDEKWNFKNGRWEKESGRLVWNGKNWATPRSVANANESKVSPTLARYRLAMNFASRRAHVSGKGKDVMGAGHPWKLNLYDDDKDGQWDRGKLDTNRDEVDDEKWNFKQGRWEKDGGKTIWNGSQWTKTADREEGPSPMSARYQAAFKLIQRGSQGQAKGKDVLGSSNPWKLNLYDDNKDGVWDRAKLDTNRDEVDDEKWNFKQGRWEKDGGKTVWNGTDWMQAP